MPGEQSSGDRESPAGRRRSSPEDDRGGELYRAVIDALPDMVFRTHGDGTVVDFVPGQDAAPYVAPEDFLDKKVRDILPPDVARLSMDAIEAALRTRKTQTFEYQLIEDGTTRDYEARVVPAGPHDVISIVRDVTRARSAERELERTRILLSAVTESTAAAAFVYQREGLVYANAAALAITGYSLDETRKLGFLQIIHPDFRKMLTDRMRSRLEGNSEPARYEFKLINKDGTEHWIDCAIGGVVEFDGKLSIIGTALDITERKRNEDELRLAREELENRIEAQTASADTYGLTFRELTVLYLLADAKQDREIADLLGISHRTVQTHVARILKKMGARSRTDASVRAHKEEIIR